MSFIVRHSKSVAQNMILLNPVPEVLKPLPSSESTELTVRIVSWLVMEPTTIARKYLGPVIQERRRKIDRGGQKSVC
jgi:hypothetical protein